LSFDGQRGRGLRIQPAEADRFAGILAVAIGAVVEPDQGQVDLVQQSVGASPVDDVEFLVNGRARLIRLIALTEGIVGADGATRTQFTPRLFNAVRRALLSPACNTGAAK